MATIGNFERLYNTASKGIIRGLSISQLVQDFTGPSTLDSHRTKGCLEDNPTEWGLTIKSALLILDGLILFITSSPHPGVNLMSSHLPF